MKNIFLILVMVIMAGTASAVQPARKPFIQIKIDGKSFKDGDILTVTPGQKLTVEAKLEGGRRDFCKFPETYSDLAGTAQILSRGENGLTYQLNDQRAEWKLLNEDFRFDTDEFVKVNSGTGKSSPELVVTSGKFSQSFVKVTIKATWQFTGAENTSQEENIATATLYFRATGSPDLWFSTQNVQAGGIKNDQVQEKLNEVQQACDSIENNFYRLKFAAVQQDIRTLQASMNSLNSTIEEVKSANPSYKTKITFIGLPSDRPYADIETFSNIKTSWATQETLINDLKQQLGNLPEQETSESKDELVTLIGKYADWQFQLPQNTFNVLPKYLPELKQDNLKMPENIDYMAKEKTVTDYAQTLKDFKAYMDSRIEQVPVEIQNINSVYTRLQAIRLFDGMLRSYFSSIAWAEWKSTRGF
ncbi:MAG: hypothetical protein WC384_06385 [Prolixibacteraceae bacterium]|jgi:hypothetical protein